MTGTSQGCRTIIAYRSWAIAVAAARHPAHVTTRLAPALAGLVLAVEGGTFGGDGTADAGRARRFVGWSTDRHWMR